MILVFYRYPFRVLADPPVLVVTHISTAFHYFPATNPLAPIACRRVQHCVVKSKTRPPTGCCRLELPQEYSRETVYMVLSEIRTHTGSREEKGIAHMITILAPSVFPRQRPPHRHVNDWRLAFLVAFGLSNTPGTPPHTSFQVLVLRTSYCTECTYFWQALRLLGLDWSP